MLSRIVVLILMMSSAACITTRSSMKEAQEKQEFQEGIATLRQGKADLESQMQQVEDENRSLMGRIEVLEKKLSDQEEAEKSELAAGEEEKVKKEEKVDLLIDSVAKLEERITALAKEVENLKKRSSSKKANSKKPAKKRGNYQQAEYDFSKKRWREAALNYQKYRELNPKGKRYQRATYNMGICFRNLKMNDEAKIFFEELVNNFKKGKYPQLAKKELKKLK